MLLVALGAIAPMVIMGGGTTMPLPMASVTLIPPAAGLAEESPAAIVTEDHALTAMPDIAQGQIACAPGQFASPFSDVLPDHWAYEAVTRLASVPVHCFDAVRTPRSLTP
jgi:hypothetical protein